MKRNILKSLITLALSLCMVLCCAALVFASSSSNNQQQTTTPAPTPPAPNYVVQASWGEKYTTMQAALDAAKAKSGTNSITILQDINECVKAANITCTVTIDLNGKKWGASEANSVMQFDNCTQIKIRDASGGTGKIHTNGKAAGAPVTGQSGVTVGKLIVARQSVIDVDCAQLDASDTTDTKATYGGVFYLTESTLNIKTTSTSTKASSNANTAQYGGFIYADNNSKVNISGKGYVYMTGALYKGGAIYLKNSTCDISSNDFYFQTVHADVAGGVFYLEGTSTLTMSGKSYIYNSGIHNQGTDSVPVYGSVVYVGKGSKFVLKGNAKIEGCADGCLKDYNWAKNNDNATGTVYGEAGSTIEIDENALIGSVSGTYGSAIYSNGTVNIKGQAVLSSLWTKREKGGAGIQVDGAGAQLNISGDATISGCVDFAGKSFNSIKVTGGAECNISGKAKIVGISDIIGATCKITESPTFTPYEGNTTRALTCWGGATVEMTGGTISGFKSEHAGAAIYMGGETSKLVFGGTASIVNCSVIKNVAGTAICVDGASFEMDGTANISGCTGVSGTIYIKGNSTIKGDGITIKDCTATTQGGGIFFDTGSHTITGKVTISKCSAFEGGGIFVTKGVTSFNSTGDLEIKDCKATWGGGIGARAPMTISNMTISGCESSTGGGGGIHTYANLTLDGATVIKNCKAGYVGGGIYAEMSDETRQLVLQGTSKVQNCTANSHGGGIFVRYGDIKIDGNSSISGCKTTNGNGGGIYNNGKGNVILTGNAMISSCEATVSGGSGGGVYSAKGPVTVSGKFLITNCKANSRGGGLYSEAAVVMQGTEAKIYKCEGSWGGGIFVRNEGSSVKLGSGSFIESCKANNRGGGIFVETKSSLELTGNSFLSSNTATDAGGGVCVNSSSFTMSGEALIDGCSAKFGGGAALYGVTGTMGGTKGFQKCVATQDAGGVYLRDSSSLTINNIIFNTCSASWGGGLYVSSGCTATLSTGRPQFLLCAATKENGDGGGIYVAGTLIADVGYFQGCCANNRGGGIYAAKNGKVTLGAGVECDGCSSSSALGGDFYSNEGTITVNGGVYKGSNGTVKPQDLQICGGWFKKKVTNPGSGYFASPKIYNAPYGTGYPYTAYSEKDKITITYVENFHDGSATVDTVKGAEITVLSCGATDEVWEFANWSTYKDGSGTIYTPGATMKPTGSMNLYGVWNVKEDAAREMVFVDTSGYNSQKSTTVNQRTAPITFPNFSRNGFKLDFWSTEADDSGQKIAVGSKYNYKNTLKVTFYAHWKTTIDVEGGNYTITYTDSSGSNLDHDFISNTSGVKLISANFVRDNYSFDYWSTGANGAGDHYYIGDMYNFQSGSSSVKLYANWKSKNEIGNASSGYNSYKEGTGSTITVDSPTDKPEDGPGGGYDPSIFGAYSITYIDSAGENDDFTFSTSSETFMLIKPFMTRDGYEASGFNTQSNGGGTSYNIGETVSFKNQSKYNLYVMWEKSKTSEQKKNNNDDPYIDTPNYNPEKKYTVGDIATRDQQKGSTTYGGGSVTERTNGNGSGGTGGGEGVDSGYSDIGQNTYYKKAVEWASQNDITVDIPGSDPTKFSPNAICDRAQMVTFLWKTMGSPEPKTAVCPFTDVPANSYYYKAALWGYEKGIIKGTTATTFSPNQSCTRAHAITFLYRLAGSPQYTARTTSFKDVSSKNYFYTSVEWAVRNGITEGTTATTFSPNKTCSRAEIVTFLYRGCSGKVIADDRYFEY